MSELQHKLFPVEIKEIREDGSGGRIRITTSSTDRDGDVVDSAGAVVENYMKSPTVQWAHNYRDPWAVIGKTTALELGPNYIDAEFELRPSANEADPQNVIRLLWNGGWVNAASIGFRPIEFEELPLEEGDDEWSRGYRFTKYEIVEWSLVPIGANQDALRRTMKSLDPDYSVLENAAAELKGDVLTARIKVDATELDAALARAEPLLKAGRALSKTNENKLRKAVDMLTDVLKSVEEPDVEDAPQDPAPEAPDDAKLAGVFAELFRLNAQLEGNSAGDGGEGTEDEIDPEIKEPINDADDGEPADDDNEPELDKSISAQLPASMLGFIRDIRTSLE